MFKKSAAYLKKPKTIIVIGMLVALNAILDLLSIRIQIGGGDMTIGLSFITTAIMGVLYGPIGGAVGATVSDIVTFFFEKSAGAFNPYYTLVALISGFLHGVFLFSDRKAIIKNPELNLVLSSVFARFSVVAVCNFVLYSLGSKLFYGVPFWASAIGKVPMYVIKFPLEVVIYIIIVDYVGKLIKSGVIKR